MARKKPGPAPKPRLLSIADEGLGPFAALTNSGAPPKPDAVEADPIASEEWDRMVALLSGRSTLSPADSGALMGYCLDYSLIERCERQLRRSTLTITNEETGAVKAHPLLGVLASAKVRLAKFAGMLGATPVDRGRAEKIADDQSKAKKLGRYVK